MVIPEAEWYYHKWKRDLSRYDYREGCFFEVMHIKLAVKDTTVNKVMSTNIPVSPILVKQVEHLNMTGEGYINQRYRS